MRLFLLCLCFLLSTSCGQRFSGKVANHLVEGKLDLSDWSFEKDGPLNLKGPWLFYWKKYIPVSTILETGLPEKGIPLTSPGLWDSLADKPGLGYGTVISKIEGLKKTDNLHFQIRPFSSSYQLFITDGKKTLSFQVGKNAPNKKHNIPQYKIIDEKLDLEGPDIYFILHVANYNYRAGGFYAPPTLYKKTSYFKDFINSIITDFFVLGILLIISIYHFAIFFQRKNDYTPLLFGAFCLVIGLRLIGTEDYATIFHPTPSKWLFFFHRKLEFFTLYAGGPIFLEYLYQFFKINNKYFVHIKNFIQGISAFYALPVIVLSPTYFSNLFLLNSYLFLISFQILFIIYLIFLEVKKESRYSSIFLMSIFVFFYGITHDILVAKNLFLPPYILPYTLIFFVFIQSYILASSFGDAYQKVEKLTNTLNEEVDKKTYQIKIQNKNFISLLSNLNQGFLVFNKEGLVEEESTKITEDFFGMTPKGKYFEEILALESDKKDNFKKWLGHVFKGMIPFKDLISLAPKTYIKKTGEIIALTYRPIFLEDKSKKISKVICIATDITKEIILEEKALQEKEKGKMVFALIDRPLELIDLIDDAHEIFEKSLQNLEFSNPDQVFRNFHTLKARLASFKITTIVGKIHQLEEVLTNIKDKKEWISTDIEKTRKSMFEAYDCFTFFIKNNRKLIEVANNSIETGDSSENILVMKDLLNNFVETYANKFIFKEIHHYFKKFIEPTKELARAQDKQIEVRIKETKIIIAGQKYKKLFSSLLHVFRNAIDHGIESREERISLEKKERALINISFETVGKGNFKIIIQDDGRGINPKQIRYIAGKNPKLKDLSLTEMPDKEVIQLIFFPGLSSKEESTDISGRGIGMDAVKYEAERIGGEVFVTSEIDKGTLFTVTLPILMPFLK